jgi:hypothetical protein
MNHTATFLVLPSVFIAVSDGKGTGKLAIDITAAPSRTSACFFPPSDAEDSYVHV